MEIQQSLYFTSEIEQSFLIGEEVEAGNYSDSSDSTSDTDSDTASSTDSDTAEVMYAINTSRIHKYIQIAVRNAILMVYKTWQSFYYCYNYYIFTWHSDLLCAIFVSADRRTSLYTV